MRELEVLESAVREAAAAVLEGDRHASGKSTDTGVYDVVTAPDVAAEKAIIGRILAEFPEDLIVSEETRPGSEMSGRAWAIDPIDGTMNYSRGIPFYGIQGVFAEDGVPKASAIYLPEQDEMFTASGDGAFLNGVRIGTAEARPLRECILTTGDFSRRSEAFRDAQSVLLTECRDVVARFKMVGAACVDFAYLAAGRTDIHVRFVNKVWDYLPGLFLAESAGAVYDRRLMEEKRLLVLCSCAEVLDEASEKISPVLSGLLR